MKLKTSVTWLEPSLSRAVQIANPSIIQNSIDNYEPYFEIFT
jgi:hypothetical protein